MSSGDGVEGAEAVAEVEEEQGALPAPAAAPGAGVETRGMGDERIPEGET